MTKSSLKLPAAALLLFGFLLSAENAQASILYLSPGNGSVPLEGTKPVQVRFSGQGDSVNGVTAVLTYPQDKLEVASISYGGSAFTIAAESSSGGGTVRISRANFAGVGGDVNVATINFRGKAAGSATVAFSGGSAAPRAADSSDSLNLGSSRGATFTIGGAAGSSQAKATPTPTPSTPLLIENIQVESVSSDSATISWTTSSKASSFLVYGLEPDAYMINTPKDSNLTNHIAKISGPLLTAGGTFHFRIKAEDSLGNEWSSENSSFHLPGYQLTVQITDEATNQPLVGVPAELFGYNQKKITNSSGQVVFDDLLPGRQLLIVKVNNQERTQEVLLSDAPLSQNYSFRVASFRADAPSQAPNMAIIIALAALAVIIVIALAIYLLRRRQSNPPSSPPSPPTFQST